MNGRPYSYEQLGAPGLIYRHAPSYTEWESVPAEPWGLEGTKPREARYLRDTQRTLNRVRARWYYPIDHHFRRATRQPDSPEKKAGRKRRRKEDGAKQAGAGTTGLDGLDKSSSDESSTGTDSQSGNKSENRKRSAIFHALAKSDPFLDHKFIKSRSSHAVDDARRDLQKGKTEAALVRRSYQQYDHAYIPGVYQRNHSQYGYAIPKLAEHRWNASLAMATERRNAEPSYLAPFDYASLHFGLQDDASDVSWQVKKLSNSRLRHVAYPVKADDPNSPRGYGNCLVCMPCPCGVCRQTQEPQWCLVHPTGDLLDRFCVSSLLFPYGPRNAAPTRKSHAKRRFQTSRHEFDVGETILQIEHCGKGMFQVDNPEHFLVRSSNYCTVVCMKPHKYYDKIDERVPQGRRLRSQQQAKPLCLGTYKIELVARIDLRSRPRTILSCRPIHVTSHPRFWRDNWNGRFAILSSNDEKSPSNTIHSVVVEEIGPLLEEHSFPSLRSITTIEFTNTHPMTLWTAATSHVRPALLGDIYSKKPFLGHGDSLYTVDLRSNTSVFQWSPSAEEGLVEGIHSISGILTDWQKDHSVLVSSISAGKTWEIDGRMTCRAVNTWSLASVCDDCGASQPAMGLYGAGSLLMDPLLSSRESNGGDSWRPFLCVNKSPGSFGIQLFQRPCVQPRFQTDSLDCVTPLDGVDKGELLTGSVARNSVFSLPDVSQGIFTCGLAACRIPTAQLLSGHNTDGMKYAKDTFAIMSMTNKGDIYSHLMRVCNADTHGRSQMFAELPEPSSPPTLNDKKINKLPAAIPKCDGGWNFELPINMQCPLPSHSLAQLFTSSKKSCRPFSSTRLEQLPTYPETKGGEHTTKGAHLSLNAFRQGFLRDRSATMENDINVRSDVAPHVLTDIDGRWDD